MADVSVDIESNDPKELVNLGHKAYVLRNYNGAVAAFSRAIEIIVADHGDKHDSLGSIYLHYGIALLELSREETEALGDAVTREFGSDSDEENTNIEDSKSTPNEDGHNRQKQDDQQEQDVQQKQDDQQQKQDDDPQKQDVSQKQEADPEKVESNPQKQDVNQSSISDPSDEKKPVKTSGTSDEAKAVVNSDVIDTVEGESSEVKPDEEPTDLQLAWEVLELAKLIFEKRGDSGKKQLAETLVVLGEVSLESENFENAIQDIKQGLEIQKTILKSDSRYLAESHYKFAMALSTNNQIDEAIENFKIALEILNSRIHKLKQNEENEKDEIKEIEDLIPEIEEKIADMKNYKEEAANKLVSTIAIQQKAENNFDAGSSKKDASDISHLVKRKRKLDDITQELEENPTKKTK